MSEERTIAVSEPLLKSLRECEGVLRAGDLPVDALVERGDGTLHRAAIDRAEAELGIALPDELLVLLALRHPVACVLTGVFDIEDVLQATLEFDGDVPEGSLRVGSAYHESFAELVHGAHGGPYRDLWTRRVQSGWKWCWRGEAGDAEEKSLGELLSETLRDELTSSDISTVFTEYAPSPVRVVASRAVDASERWVKHPKFGRGVVVEVTGVGGDAKVRVRFKDVGEKKLLARFLRFL